jgi:hypothetical protein
MARGQKTLRKQKCSACGDTIIVVRHPDDALKPMRNLPSTQIRISAYHLKVLGYDFLEAATAKDEFRELVANASCPAERAILRPASADPEITPSPSV